MFREFRMITVRCLRVLAMALLVLPILAACGGGDDEPPPTAVLPVEEPYRLFIFQTLDPQGDSWEVRSAEQTGGVLFETQRFGGLTFAPPGRDATADGEIYSSASGKTYWVETEAPNGDVLDPSSRIGSNALLKQQQRYRKRAADATMELVITDAQLEIIDSNGVSPLFAHCPWEQAATNSERCFDNLSARLEMWVTVDVLGGGGTATNLDGVVQLSGWGGNFKYAVFSTQTDPLSLRTERGLIYKPLWRLSDFEIDYDPANPGTARVHLRRPLKVDVDLSFVPVWTPQQPLEFLVTVIVDAKTNNRRGREAVVFARLRDPLNVGGVQVDVTGLEPVNGPKPMLPPAPPTPSPACTNAAGQDGGALQFTASTYLLPEFGITEAVVFVSRTGGSTGAAGARLRTSDGSATAGTDYTPLDLTVWFADGDDRPRAIPLAAINDARVTGDRTLTLTLAEPLACATLGSQASAEVTLVDDDSVLPPPSTFSVGGTVTGLAGSGLVLEDRAQAIALPIAASGTFQFNRAYSPGANYDVRVATQPSNPLQVCTVTRGAGTVSANVTDIAVDCAAPPPPPSGLDPSFGSGGRATPGLGSIKAIALQSDGRIVAAIGNTLARYHADGTPDTGFGTGGSVAQVLGNASGNEIYDIAVDGNDRIVVVGTGRAAATSVLAYDFAAARFNADGSRDDAFNGGHPVFVDFIGAQDRATRVLLQPDGRIVLAGLATTVYTPTSDDADFAAVRLNGDGSLDSGFGSGGRATAPFAALDFGYAAALQPDGRIVVAGRVSDDRADESDVGVARFNADGSLDTTFGIIGRTRIDLSANWDEATAMTVQPDGRLVIAVAYSEVGNFAFGVLRLNADGSRDSGFGSNGFVATQLAAGQENPLGIALQSDGRIVVAGLASGITAPSNFAIVRYLADGALDAAFGTGGVYDLDFFGGADGANDLLIQPDGRIVAAGVARNGLSGQSALVRLLP
jgi:uncharacterized delta-60 repeat protein